VPDHTLLRQIGRGSYGEVWLARNTLGTPRAVKVVYRNSFEDDRPYEREYTGIRKFEPVSRSHEGLIHVLHAGRNDAEGYFYYVMELADAVGEGDGRSQMGDREKGLTANTLSSNSHLLSPREYSPRTLRSELRARGRLPASECISLGASLCGGLTELHRRGLIHRDIKPSNIIFVGGVPKLADIGLVTDAVESGTYVGTEGFIPPEGPNSPQADVFSLGKVLYEAGMGKDRLDFPEPATGIEELPDRDALIELNAILLKACQPDRRQRYSSATAMLADLELLQRGKSVREKRWSERRLRWMAAAALTVCVLTALALGVDRFLERRASSMQGKSSPLHPSLIGKVEQRDAAAGPELTDLTFAYTAPLTERWYPGPAENTLAALPRGLRKFDGTLFDVRGIVQLGGGEIASYGASGYPPRIRDIPIERWVKKLHFLQGAVSEVGDGVVIGSYRIFYNTTRQVEVPLVYGGNVRALWQPLAANAALTNAAIAWRGQNPATQPRGLELRLYQFTWENPWPAEQIVALDFSTANANAAPFLVALTAEDASIPPEQRRVSVNLVPSIQAAAVDFQNLPVLAGGESFHWSPLKLNTKPVEIGGRFYDGFRFTAPPKETFDLVWSFSPARTPFQGWFILPMKGGMKVGFEDWYHVEPLPPGAAAEPGDRVVQFLSGRKLEPGREYFIWFGSDTSQPVELQAALRFVPPGRADANQPERLLSALGLPTGDGAKFHRHYCLGAVR
jgi:hypothetical protein